MYFKEEKKSMNWHYKKNDFQSSIIQIYKDKIMKEN
jgi:hypothetical protein